ncbi:alpha/beta hydrolase family esterase [Nocardia sp. NPDC057227]|uniref:alpha/beta hydrolase family esterase n=1 Tax=Nocardia sp. NPDC057227 TaxID=3346056 RepID=UPI00362E0E49
MFESTISSFGGGSAGRRRGGRFRIRAAVSMAIVALAFAGGPAQAEPQAPAPVPSQGCGSSAPEPGQTSNTFRGTEKSGQYLLSVPAGADRPLPLVIALHGLLENKEIAELGSGFGEHGARNGFITVTPQLDRLGVAQWEYGPGSADLEWVMQVLTHVEADLCVDTGRVYVAGLSMGAFAASSIGCRFADRVAAIAAVSGLRDFTWCAPARAVPVIAFHGTDDAIVPYAGQGGTGSASGSADENSGVSTSPVTDNAAAWARRDGCTGGPARQTLASDVVVDRYTCPAGVDVHLYSILGGGHIWPGTSSSLYPSFIVGNNTTSIDATASIWEFFRTHPAGS